MQHHRLLLMMAPLALLVGCGDPGDDGGAIGGLTADEAKQLDDAAEMLDTGNRPPLPTNTLAAEAP
jgi:hypothetical protein